MRRPLTLLAAAVLTGPAAVAQEPTQPAAKVQFVYSDYDRFVDAFGKVQAGAPDEATFQAYVDGAGPAYPTTIGE